jgi:hypothetical protein
VIVVIFILVFVQLQVTVAHTQMCFRGRPTPRCKSFLITEFGVGYRIGGEYHFPEQTWASADIGWMYNLNEKHAVGVTTYIPWDLNVGGLRYGLKLRGRRWLTQDFSLDASGGALLGGGEPEKYPSFTGHFGLNYRDYVGPYLGIDVLRTAEGSDTHWHGGVRFGAAAGTSIIAGTAALLTLLLLGYWPD